MNRLFINSKNGHVALTEDGKLREIYINQAGHDTIVGQIILGRLDAILPGQFAFVDIGQGKNALMNTSRDVPLKKGQPVLVQVYKDPTGAKGAYVGTELRHKGQYVIISENQANKIKNDIGISQKITDPKERKRIRTIVQQAQPKGYSIIARTNAEGVDSEIIASEIEALHSLHHKIKSRAQHSVFPATIYPNAKEAQLHSLLTDLLSDNLSEIWVSGNDYNEIKRTITGLIPSLEDRIIFYDEADGPGLFSAKNITTQIATALNKTVQLPCGGFITIEQTEACVVIDVNTGRFTGQKDSRTTFLETNLEAAACIAWQIALRNLSGIIIIDFIDMKYQTDIKILLDALKSEISKDRIKTELVGITTLGLVQLTRKRTREPLARLLEKECPACKGKGRIATE